MLKLLSSRYSTQRRQTRQNANTRSEPKKSNDSHWFTEYTNVCAELMKTKTLLEEKKSEFDRLKNEYQEREEKWLKVKYTVQQLQSKLNYVPAQKTFQPKLAKKKKTTSKLNSSTQNSIEFMHICPHNCGYCTNFKNRMNVHVSQHCAVEVKKDKRCQICNKMFTHNSLRSHYRNFMNDKRQHRGLHAKYSSEYHQTWTT